MALLITPSHPKSAAEKKVPIPNGNSLDKEKADFEVGVRSVAIRP